METPHERPDLEARLPPTIAGIPPHVSSESGSDPPFRRTIEMLEEAANDADVDLAGLGVATGAYRTGSGLEGITVGDCEVALWSLPRQAPDTLAGIIRTSLRPHRRPLRWLEREDTGGRCWCAETHKPLPVTWCVLTVPDAVVTIVTDDHARLDEAIAWFRESPTRGGSVTRS